MLGWFFKKKSTAPGAASVEPSSAKAPAAKAPPAKTASTSARTASGKRPPPAKPGAPAPQPKPAAAPAVDWSARLAQAQGDDEALLALLREGGAPLSVKQAAVEGLHGEAALKQAEHDGRGHDRRVHQLAKRRLQARVAQRQTREQAAQLIATARALAAEADVAVNRGVGLDQAWQALDASAIEPEQREAFAALSAQLTARVRQRAELELQHKRWLADATQALHQLQAACTEAAAGTQDRAALAAATGAARQVASALPADAATDRTDKAAQATGSARARLSQAIDTAVLLDQHLAVLERLTGAEVGGEASAPTDADAVAHTVVVAESAPADPALASSPDPALASLADPALAALVQARHDRWQQGRDDARIERQTQRQARTAERQRSRQGQHDAALVDALTQAEAALDDGQLAQAQRHLGQIDHGLKGAEAPEALRARLGAAQARLAQLRGWQHWAGARARDELVLQAEALAAATLATTARPRTGRAGVATAAHTEPPTDADPAAEGEAEGEAAGSPESGEPAEAHRAAEQTEQAAQAESAEAAALDAEVARLSIRQRIDLIDTLRTRWKEMDRLTGSAGSAGSTGSGGSGGSGGTGHAGGQALWPRFDAALKAAYAPVAAHIAAQRAQRDTNLQIRQQLLDALQAVSAAGPIGTGAVAEAGPAPAAPEAPEAPDARAQARRLAGALDRFQAEWRKLGPLEHTVPREARGALTQRHALAVQGAQAPLQAARQQARAEREALVARARALGGEGPGRGRDLVAEVRALQADWQQHAKALPLGRGEEQALWTAFKAAIDAVFAEREAAFSARDAEFEAHAAERSALIERLQLRPDDSPALQRRTLAEVDADWRRCGPAPRARAAALDAAYQGARAALVQWLDQSAQRAWAATCDALDAKLALCLTQEQGTAAGPSADAQPDGAQADGTPAGGPPARQGLDTTAGPASDTAAAWQALPALPGALEDALRRRAGLAPALARTAPPAPPADDLMLQIETDWQLPTPPAFEAARRAHKLLAMKAALEGRRAGELARWTPDAALAHLLGLPDSALDAAQHQRLSALRAAWRQRGPQRAG